jgi:hypothetical protein
MTTTAYDQLVEHEFDLVACLVNTTGDNAGFRVALRAIPALPSNFTMGDMARAYASYLLDRLNSFKQ